MFPSIFFEKWCILIKFQGKKSLKILVTGVDNNNYEKDCKFVRREAEGDVGMGQAQGLAGSPSFSNSKILVRFSHLVNQLVNK